FFYPNTTSDAAHGNTCRVAVFAVSPNHQTFKNLHTLFVAFFNFLMNAHRVTATYIDNGRFFELVIYFLDYRVHRPRYAITFRNSAQPLLYLVAWPTKKQVNNRTVFKRARRSIRFV